MTIDESEIRRLARYREIAHVNAYGCSMRGTQQVHSAECDNIVGALAREYASALAAEREQHARDVGEAVEQAVNDVLDNVLTCDDGETDVFATVRSWRLGDVAARVKLVNDSRPGEAGGLAAGADGGTTVTSASGQAPRRPPPSGINQGSGAGEECAHGHAYEDCCWRGTPPSPASPAGETRDEPCPKCGFVLHDVTIGTKYHCVRCGHDFAASAPGGAPGVETCGTCEGTGVYPPCHRMMCSIDHADEECHACRGAGTTPTPSTETPTGGR